MFKTRKTKEINVVLDARWQPGIWLGRTWGTINHRVATSAREVIEVRAVHRVPKTERWDQDLINNLQATPWQWTVPEDGEQPVVVIGPRLAGDPAAPPEPVARPARYSPKRLYIMPEDLEK